MVEELILADVRDLIARIEVKHAEAMAELDSQLQSQMHRSRELQSQLDESRQREQQLESDLEAQRAEHTAAIAEASVLISRLRTELSLALDRANAPLSASASTSTSTSRQLQAGYHSPPDSKSALPLGSTPAPEQAVTTRPLTGAGSQRGVESPLLTDLDPLPAVLARMTDDERLLWAEASKR